MRSLREAALGIVVTVGLSAGCAASPGGAARPTAPSATTTVVSAPTASARASTAGPPTASAHHSATSPRTGSPTSAPGELTSLVGNTRNAIAWAPVSHPTRVTVEGSVPSTRAWSTSKVLVVAAYLDTVAHGDPSVVPATERGWIKAALTASDAEAIVALRARIPGSPGAAIEHVLRGIGDTTTTAPDTSQGRMQWSVRAQVRFMAALATGRVVSAPASAFLLSQLNPIAAYGWGLGTIGASAFKGGWLRADTETRQMGIVGDYAVVVITAGDGPAVRQSDGDSAHVRQMNRLAALLARRLS